MDSEISILANFDKFKIFLLDNDIFDILTLSKLTTCNDNKINLIKIISDIESRDQIKIDKFAETMLRSSMVIPPVREMLDEVNQTYKDLKICINLKTRFEDLLLSPKACGEVLEVKHAEKLRLKHDIYPMTSRPRGFCVIIDNQLFDKDYLPFRNGSRADADRLSNVFTQLDFKVLLFRNQTSTQIKTLLKHTIAKNEELVKHDALAVVFLTHGFIDDIYGTDGLPIPVGAILEYLNNENCPHLQNKPKIFFLCACIEGKINLGIQAHNSNNKILLWSDIFIYYLSIIGNKTLSNKSTDSCFGYELAHGLAEFAHKEHLHDLVTINIGDRVQQRMNQMNRSPVEQVIETLTIGTVKKLYFNPGF